MFWYHKKCEKKEVDKGVLLQVIGAGDNLNALHWNMKDKSEVKMHQHPQEQFGFVLKGGFDMIVGDEQTTLEQGDAYFIPPDVPHAFTAIGDTEAIDIFSPPKTKFPFKVDL